MYEFVNDAEIRPYRLYCSKILTNLRSLLMEKYEINTQFILVGSGAKNMVMRDGSGPFDLDYNLVIINMPNMFWENLDKLKNTIISTLNKIVGQTCFSDGHDSTSVITSYLHSNTTCEVIFKFDIAILGKNNLGNLCRLVHNKKNKQYTWNEVPYSKNVKDKANTIKTLGFWDIVRSKYKELKNHYLRHHDENHPSFVVYVETVNQIYEIIQKGGINNGKKSRCV